MPSPNDAFFFAASGFIVGTIISGLGFPPIEGALFLLIAIPILFILRTHPALIAIVVACFLAGNLYYAIDDHRYVTTQHAIADSSSFTGTVVGIPRARIEHQTAIVQMEKENARVYIHTDLYPTLSYGDVVHLTGSIVPPPADSYGDFMAKERVHGTLFQPEIAIIGNEANSIFTALYATRQYIKDSTARLFTQKQAAFLGGILLGDRDEFTDEFLEKLSVSGTMHLTALSGLHMTIIVFLMIAVFGVIFWKREGFAFAATFATVALFVAMTGFKVSAVRASLMAFLVGLAKQSNRIYNPRNAIAFAALIIALWNPKAPVFDLAFQLSFAATLSIIYFTPVLKRLPFFHVPGALGWRDVLAITSAAQIGVAPIIIMHFSTFSFTALLANVAILVVMPFIMALGFITVALSLVSAPLAALTATPVAFLVDYAIGVIETFAVIRIMFNPEIGTAPMLMYYATMVWMCWRWSKV